MDKLLEIINLKSNDLTGVLAQYESLKNQKNDIEKRIKEIIATITTLNEDEYKKLKKKDNLYKMIPILAALLILATFLLFSSTIAPTTASFLLSLVGYVGIPSLIMIEATAKREKLCNDHLKHKKLKSKYSLETKKDRENTATILKNEIDNLNEQLLEMTKQIDHTYINVLQVNKEINELKNMRSQIVEAAINEKFKNNEINLKQPKVKSLK